MLRYPICTFAHSLQSAVRRDSSSVSIDDIINVSLDSDKLFTIVYSPRCVDVQFTRARCPDVLAADAVDFVLSPLVFCPSSTYRRDVSTRDSNDYRNDQPLGVDARLGQSLRPKRTRIRRTSIALFHNWKKPYCVGAFAVHRGASRTYLTSSAFRLSRESLFFETRSNRRTARRKFWTISGFSVSARR